MLQVSVPECYKSQEMCDKTVDTCPFVFDSIPDQYDAIKCVIKFFPKTLLCYNIVLINVTPKRYVIKLDSYLLALVCYV